MIIYGCWKRPILLYRRLILKKWCCCTRFLNRAGSIGKRCIRFRLRKTCKCKITSFWNLRCYCNKNCCAYRDWSLWAVAASLPGSPAVWPLLFLFFFITACSGQLFLLAPYPGAIRTFPVAVFFIPAMYSFDSRSRFSFWCWWLFFSAS